MSSWQSDMELIFLKCLSKIIKLYKVLLRRLEIVNSSWDNEHSKLTLFNWVKNIWQILKVLIYYEARKLYKGSPNISKKCWSLRRPLHFLRTCLLKAGFGMEVQPHWPLFQFQKDFTVKGYKNYWYYSFQIQIKVKNFENVRWKYQICL